MRRNGRQGVSVTLVIPLHALRLNCRAARERRSGRFPSDGTGDLFDSDIDADGLLDKFDPCPFTALGVAIDADGRSQGDIDLDCDTVLDDYRLFQLGFNGSSD